MPDYSDMIGFVNNLSVWNDMLDLLSTLCNCSDVAGFANKVSHSSAITDFINTTSGWR